MPLFQLTTDGARPFRRINSSADIYETEIESLFWTNLEAFAGEPLFPLARQARLPGGGIPDLLALDPQGRVVVVEVKRDIDRSQLAQCLEYAGWARTTSLDELAGLYAAGTERFFTDWQDFTGTTTPMLLERAPRLVLVARSFDPRTESALRYLRESGVPWKLIQVVFYEDADGSRIVDVNHGEVEGLRPSRSSSSAGSFLGNSVSPAKAGAVSRALARTDVTLSDLLEAGLVEPEEPIEWHRPQVRQHHRAHISASGAIVLPDGQTFTSLSTAANVLASGSYNGWECWTLPNRKGVKIGTLRNSPLLGDR